MEKTPIPLRIHHLATLQEAMQSGIIKYGVSALQEFSSYRQKPIDHYLFWYYHDVIGDSSKEHACVLALTLAVKKYLMLEPSIPIKLISNDKDLICNQATTGEHCHEKAGHGSIEREARAITLLEEVIQSHQIIGPFERIGTLSDLDTFHVLTTMGTLKNILHADKNLGARLVKAC